VPAVPAPLPAAPEPVETSLPAQPPIASMTSAANNLKARLMVNPPPGLSDA
jgi:hypothetical protein